MLSHPQPEDIKSISSFSDVLRGVQAKQKVTGKNVLGIVAPVMIGFTKDGKTLQRARLFGFDEVI